MDELLKTRNELMLQLNVQYSNLVNFLNTLPINQKFKEHCFQNLDQGVMWAQKGIEFLQIEKQNVPQEIKGPEDEKLEAPFVENAKTIN